MVGNDDILKCAGKSDEEDLPSSSPLWAAGANVDLAKLCRVASELIDLASL